MKTLGDILIEEGIISEKDLEDSLKVQKKTTFHSVISFRKKESPEKQIFSAPYPNSINSSSEKS
ncbi:hypothetical protein LEP1GSC083_2198 [Leptospira interrogans serovar Pyrogenes str. L0374]|uniref:Type II secretion system protein GspE N-terminal domain-containing protein n=5 Tax=Leptospira interrogans TaxID=173 RepID=M6ZM67_LEPIR|nr:hypothetical protein LEP1GSC148_1037 [Leptospira interrogans serovar Canicola str. LT1962]EMM83522.1 hypothetical protein LEP1GSC037_4464 [Leptospira interrogans str. 2006001854]EMM96531.1 hypothetical protein LEP1GSC158_1452 [Leptospira interrogans serovar Zanoni str. LT2156]EMN30862.1 hypothetical protein LEP1GSC083_2198 [Leptospira interrogans serovar Pyrogenes str. L0374]EMP07523.1 hypothetical protein LEP1GSC124_2006 [Leptospira interrogans serovar Pyrogenes str. 200701872]EMY27769.1 h